MSHDSDTSTPGGATLDEVDTDLDFIGWFFRERHGYVRTRFAENVFGMVRQMGLPGPLTLGFLVAAADSSVANPATILMMVDDYERMLGQYQDVNDLGGITAPW